MMIQSHDHGIVNYNPGGFNQPAFEVQYLGFLNFSTTVTGGIETRPKNMTVKIWKRIS